MVKGQPANGAATRGGMKLPTSWSISLPRPTFDEVRLKSLSWGDSGAASPRHTGDGLFDSSHRCGSRFHPALGGHFALEAGLGQFATGVGRRGPDLGEKVLLAVAIENQLANIASLSGVHPYCHRSGGGARILALNQRNSLTDGLNLVFAGGEPFVPHGEVKRNLCLQEMDCA